MAITEAQKRATNKYRSKFDAVQVRVTKEEKQLIKEYCKKKNISISTGLKEIFMPAITKELDKEQK